MADEIKTTAKSLADCDQLIDWSLSLAAHAPEADCRAVDTFSEAMKAKLDVARRKGRGGWPECSLEELWDMLRYHVGKGDNPVDIANIAMMIYHNSRRAT